MKFLMIEGSKDELMHLAQAASALEGLARVIGKGLNMLENASSKKVKTRK